MFFTEKHKGTSSHLDLIKTFLCTLSHVGKSLDSQCSEDKTCLYIHSSAHYVSPHRQAAMALKSIYLLQIEAMKT